MATWANFVTIGVKPYGICLEAKKIWFQLSSVTLVFAFMFKSRAMFCLYQDGSDVNYSIPIYTFEYTTWSNICPKNVPQKKYEEEKVLGVNNIRVDDD